MGHKLTTCFSCDGIGIQRGGLVPDECGTCGGSGKLCRYDGGLIAKWYGGPIVGKEPSHTSTEKI